MADNTPFQVANLPAGLKEPGIYVTVRSDGDPGLSAANQRCLLWGYQSSTATFPPNAPIRAINQDQVDAGAGATSMLAHAYAAAKSQVPIGAEIYLMPLIAPSSGTAQIVTVEITGEPTAGVTSTATTATAADTVTVKYRGRGVTVGIAAGDAWATIATNIKTAWDLLLNAPASCTRSSAALSFTNPHKGLYDNGAIEVSFASNGASGVAATFGTIAFSGTAGMTGTATVTMGKHTAVAVITSGDILTVSSAAVTAKLRSDNYPIRAAEPAILTGTITLYFVNDRPIRPLSVSCTLQTVTTQTVTATVGTAGAGVPTLTSAIANLNQLDDYYKVWSIFYTTTTELSATAVQVEAQAAPAILKQTVVIFETTASATSVANTDITNATTPKLNASARYMPVWGQFDINAGWENAARIAAAVASETYVAANWNRLELQGDVDAPCLGIHPGDRPTTDERNIVIASYRHCPLTVNSEGNVVVTWGGTSYKNKSSKDAKLTKLSGRLTLDYYNSDLVATLEPYVKLKLKSLSEPRTNRATSPRRIEAAVIRWLKRLDDADLYDGAEALQAAVRAAVVISPGRVDVNIPFNPPADIDIIAPVGILT